MTKLHATVHPSKKDKWEFSNKDDLDPCLSCYIKCAASELYQDVLAGTGVGGRAKPDRSNTAPIDQLYLFIELITTVRCPQDVQMTRKGVLRNQNSPTRKRKTVSSDKDKNGDTATMTARSRLGAFFSGSGTASATSDRTETGSRRNRGKARDETSERDQDENDEPENRRDNRRDRGGRNRRDGDVDEEEDDDDDDLDLPPRDPSVPVPTVEMCSGWVMIPIAAALAAAGTPSPQAIAALTQAGELSLARGVKPAPTGAGGSAHSSSHSIPVTASAATTTPTTTAIRSKKLTFSMRGGTAFGQVSIEKEAVVQRGGIMNTMRRAVGIEQKSIIEVLVKPSSLVTPAPSRLMNTTLKNALPPNPDIMMTMILPQNIVLPSNSVSCVGTYRTVLERANSNSSGAERLLPQTGALPYADVILSSFPKILADPAASRVLFALWSKEAPAATLRPTDTLTLSDILSTRAQQSFKEIVLRVYRAFSNPDAQPDKLSPVETLETIFDREKVIRGLLGLPEPGQTFSSTTSSTASTGKSNPSSQGIAAPSTVGRIVSAVGATATLASSIRQFEDPAAASAAEPAPLVDHLYTPFNARELVVPVRNIL